MTARHVFAFFALATMTSGGCGARSELANAERVLSDASAGDGPGSIADPDAGTGGAVTDAGTDVPLVDALADAPSDRVVDALADAPSDGAVETSVLCTADHDCDDAIGCTVDRCDHTTFTCTHAPDDGLCDDGVACTIDTCDEARRTCSHEPDSSSCPLSHECDLLLGCQARAFAHSAERLYSVRLPSGQVQEIGPFDPPAISVTDVALHPMGVLYGVSNQLYSVNPATAVLTPVSNSLLPFINALDVAPDGTLYAAGGDTVYTLDRATGVSTVFVTLPATSSGDLAFLQGRLLITTTGLSGPGDELVEIDPVTHTTSVVGSIGYDCVYGLAAFGSKLYGMSCEGRILGIDATTGQGTELSQAPVVFWGASAR